MTTEVIIKRKFNNSEIRQSSKTGYFCASDMVNAGNKWRFTNDLKQFNYSQWLKNPTTVKFIKALENETGEKAIIKGNAKNSLSWIHPFLFIDLALAIGPALKVKVYRWIYDDLIKYRNDSGDSYKKMCGALYLTISNKSKFEDEIKDFVVKIRDECDVEDWQTATQEQLKLRDKIHENIALLSDIIRDRDLLFETAVRKAKENNKF